MRFRRPPGRSRWKCCSAFVAGFGRTALRRSLLLFGFSLSQNWSATPGSENAVCTRLLSTLRFQRKVGGHQHVFQLQQFAQRTYCLDGLVFAAC